ncbi:CARDB domain-containing protein [Halalkaliarchaeum sp. AArc-GB]|uniref:CARDB domain-containing protein n=1 Tax=Halalkaliarchaeum sp. AArc-GB TaxID=3074078 RepID=UPI00285A6EBD|nr:CARDB domain-containing protein [Halalkaliarchaeum sp. AArc-GB]MDR5673441.1 CARDB domain-containing protein [Halalkaliarchaeum sp. AArc-GB]
MASRESYTAMYGSKGFLFWICAMVLASSLAAGGVAFVAGANAAVNDAEFEVTDATLSESTIIEGESVTVSATVENVGDRAGTFTAELQIDGDVVEREDVTVGPGESKEVTFSWTANEADDYEIAVSGESAGTLVVLEPADIEVDDVELSEDEILEGETVEVTVELENDGEAEGSFTAELQIDGETVDEKEVTVAPDTTEAVTFTRQFDEPGAYEIAVSGESGDTLEVKAATAEFEVDDVELSADEIFEGETVEVTAEIANDGEAEGSFTAELQIDGEMEDTADVTVDGGGVETVSFSQQFDEAGEYAIAVSGQSAGQLTVQPEPEPDLSVTRATLSESTITEGESVTVSATVENDGDAPGSLELELFVNETVEDDANVSVNPGEEEIVTFDFLPEEAGEYAITVNDEHAGTLSVKTPADLELTDANVDTDAILVGSSTEVTAEIANHGDRDGDMVVDLEVDGNISKSRTVTVTGGASKTVSFLEQFDDPGEYDVSVNSVNAGTVTVETPANLTVTNASLEPHAVVEGESVTVSATVENDGDREGDLRAELVVDGEIENSTTVSLGGHETETITFTYTPGDADEDGHEIAVNDASAGFLDVLEPADISVVNASLDSESIEEGESVQVTADIENVGEVAGTTTVRLQVDDETVESSNVTVDSNATETETFTRTFDEPGEYNLSVESIDVGVVTVEESSSGSPSGPVSTTPITTPDPPSDDPQGDEPGPSDDPQGDEPESSEPTDEGDEEPIDVEPTINRTETSDAVTVRIENATDDSVVVPVDLAGPETVQPSLSLSSLEIDPAGDREAFAVTVSQPVVDPGDRPAVPRGDVLAYVDLDTDLDANATTDATLRFELDRTAIPDGLTPENVAVLRYADGEWTADGVAHDVVESGNTEDVHRVRLPELSPVTVVALEPGTVEVLDADVPADWVRAGHETELHVTARNPGDLPATRTLVLEADGNPVEEWDVSLDAGETTTVEFTFTPTRGGTLTLEGTDAGTLAVGDGDDEVAADRDATSTDIPGFGPIVAVFALLIAALAVHVRRSH